MRSTLLTLCVASALALPTRVLAQAAPASSPVSAPTPDAAGAQPLVIIVRAVQGGAQYRNPGEHRWKALSADMHLAEGVSLRTGPHGVAQFTVGTDQVFRIDRLSVVTILRANLRPDGTIQTDVGMQYGRVSKDVDDPQHPHQDQIVSPSSTLAVRGTHVSLYDQPPYVPEAISLTGEAIFATLGRERVAFGAHGQGTATVNADRPDPAGNALAAQIVDPSIAAARTSAEQKLLADVITTGAVVNFTNTNELPIVRGTGTLTDAQTASLAAGTALVFTARWNTNTNVDFQLINAASVSGESVIPVGGLDTSKLGAFTPFDNEGGPGGGYELIEYPTANFPSGIYALGAVNRGPLPTTVIFNGFQNQNGTLVPVPLVANGTQILSGQTTNQYTTTLPVNGTAPFLALVNFASLLPPGGFGGSGTGGGTGGTGSGGTGGLPPGLGPLKLNAASASSSAGHTDSAPAYFAPARFDDQPRSFYSMAKR